MTISICYLEETTHAEHEVNQPISSAFGWFLAIGYSFLGARYPLKLTVKDLAVYYAISWPSKVKHITIKEMICQTSERV